MDHIQGTDRDQLTWFPEALDDYIAQDNPVRFIDAFVDSLDLQSLGFAHALPPETGRPPYHPGDLLRLYVYGYLNRIRSSRLLEKEAGRNLELVWLLGKLTPDFKTIADFRKDNRKAIRQVCRAFVLLCRDLDLFGGELVAIPKEHRDGVDGSKFKASNNRARNITQRQLKRQLKDLDQKIDTYLHDLDDSDASEPDTPKLSAQELQEKIDALKSRRGQLLELSQEMEDAGQTQISLTDPDSRSMPAGGGQVTDVSYNVQVSVDQKHKLIVDHEVTNEPTDRNLLYPMALRAQEALGVDHLEVVADMGYREACCARQRPAGQSLHRERHHPLPAPGQHLGQQRPRSVWEEGLPLRCRSGLLPLPGRTDPHFPLPNQRSRPRHPDLHHVRLRLLSPQTSMHPQSRQPAHHPLGRRSHPRGHGRTRACSPREGQAPQVPGRASLRDDQTPLEPGVLPDQRVD